MSWSSQILSVAEDSQKWFEMSSAAQDDAASQSSANTQGDSHAAAILQGLRVPLRRLALGTEFPAPQPNTAATGRAQKV